MLLTIAYTGMRWSETIGLERDLLLPPLINVEWQLREISGMFHRLPPKDDSYRSTSWEPYLPVDLPPFLARLLTAQAKERSLERCACVGQHEEVDAMCSSARTAATTGAVTTPSASSAQRATGDMTLASW